MKLHEIKLSEPYAKAKKDGIKPFEIRKNDRDYKVGDLVKYNIVENYTEPYPPNRTLTRESQNKELTNYFDNRVFKIKYITDYEQKDGYVVFVDEGYYIGEYEYEHRWITDSDAYKKGCKETAAKLIKFIEFHSISKRDKSGYETFTISNLCLREILREEFGFTNEELQTI